MQPTETLLTTLALLAQKAKAVCLTCFWSIARWPSQVSPSEREEQIGGICLSLLVRLVYGSIALCVLVGELPIIIPRNTAIQHIEQVTPLHLPLDVLSGLLLVFVPALWLALALDVSGIFPAEARLLPHIEHRPLRVLLFRVAFACFLLSMLTNFLFALLGQAILDGAPVSNLDILLVALPSALSAALGFFALWALVLGLLALASLGFGLLGLFWGLVAALCVMLLNYKRSRYLLQAQGFTPWRAPVPTTGSAPLLVSAQLPVQRTQVIALPTVEEEEAQGQERHLMDEQHMNATLLVFGDMASMFWPCLSHALAQVGANPCIRAAGGVDLNRPQPITRVEQDVTPALEGIIQTSAHLTKEALYQPVSADMIGEIFQRHSPGSQSHGHILILFDLPLIGHLQESIAQLKERLPRHTIVLGAMLPEPVQRDQTLMSDFSSLLSCCQQKAASGKRVVETTMVFDSHGPLAMTKGRAFQESLIAQALASLLIAHAYPEQHNPTFAQVAERLGVQAAFTGIACATGWVVAQEHNEQTWKLLRRAHQDLSPSGSLADCLAQAKHLTQQVMHERQTLTTAAAIAVERPCILVYNVPLPLTDQRLSAFISQMQIYVSREFPLASVVILPSNGTMDAGPGRGFYVQVTCFYPINQPSSLFTSSVAEAEAVS